MNKRLLLAAVFTASLGFTSPILAQDNTFEMWPSAQYKTSIPTSHQILGYELGERITSHADTLKYYYALQQAAPDNIKVVEFGETWEGRKLVYAVIGSKQNLTNLEEFAEKMNRLADPCRVLINLT